MDLLKVVNVSKKYSNHLALDKVSLNVPENSIFGLLGPNGAGKTTLIRIINQITGPDEGEILLSGNNLKPSDVEKIGYLPEERGLYKKMKVGEQALYLCQLKGLSKNDALKKLKYWFEKFEIQAWWDRRVEELSKGMQQKVQFIVTILHEPKLLIFDEPFSGFDPINANLIKEEIIGLKNNGSTIIFSTHNMASVEELCDNIALINKSKKILDGKVYEIKKEYKSNTFSIDCSNSENNFNIQEFLDKRFAVLSIDVKNDALKIKIKIPTEFNSNDLLKNIIPHVNIISFNEIIPTMNDIFIQRVSQDNPN
ncbi:MAG: ATP-binding cassette domain-containing protein [Bacteroidota bacterium]|nr:ATP-binding cassette domain-containing protein [Bacteroidota bacterium]